MNTTDPSQNEAAKLAWEKPVLVTYGDVEKITAAGQLPPQPPQGSSG